MEGKSVGRDAGKQAGREGIILRDAGSRGHGNFFYDLNKAEQ